MRKQNRLHTILYIITFSCLFSSISHAGLMDWAKRKAQQTREYAQRKFNDAQKVVADLQLSLQESRACMVRGDCKPGQKDRLKSLAKKVVIAMTAVIVAAIAVFAAKKFLSSKDEGVIEISGPEEKEGESIGIDQLARKYGFKFGLEEQDTEIGKFFYSVSGGLINEAKQYASVVDSNVLGAGIEVAQRLKNMDMQRSLNDAKNSITDAVRRANALLLEKIKSGIFGVVNDVRSVYCSLEPTRDAVLVGLETARDKLKKTAQAVYRDIIHFLEEPRCTG